MTSSRPTFSVDEMLGTLARWLRILGYDAVYHRDQNDNQIVEFARAEGRLLLTRDRELAMRAGDRGLYVLDDDLIGQLKQVSEEYDLSLDETMTRCTVCNGQLDVIDPEDLEGEVPEGALRNNNLFYRCRDCGKIYWKGSHWKDIRARLDTINGSDQMDHPR